MKLYRIRKMDAKDTGDIGRIHASIVRRPVDPEFHRQIESQVRNPDHLCLVAEADGRIVGFMIGYVLTFSFGIEKSAWIATLGVASDHMGQGIGEGLFQEISAAYRRRGINRVYTAVPWDASDVLSFFKSLGFDSSDFINLKMN